MKLYVVKMNRWGDTELHSYIEGVYSTKIAAEIAGKLNQEYRANKYEPEILEFPLNERRYDYSVLMYDETLTYEDYLSGVSSTKRGPPSK